MCMGTRNIWPMRLKGSRGELVHIGFVRPSVVLGPVGDIYIKMRIKPS